MAKTLGHRALFGKGLRMSTVEERLAPYSREEVTLVLSSLAALLAAEDAESADAQRAMVHSFFLESAAQVETKIRAGCVIFHRPQVLETLKLALAHCEGDRATEPSGAAFFEGIARILTAVTDLLAPPKPPRVGAKAGTRERLQRHLNHLLACEPLPPNGMRADVLRAHHLLFERAPRLAALERIGNLAGAFHERNGVRCQHWFSVGVHLLAKTLDYSLATMHQHQPMVRIASDFHTSPLETRQIERLFAPMCMGIHRAGDRAREALAGGAARGLGLFRRRPVLHLLEDTYVAVDPHLLAETLASDLGGRLVSVASDHDEARRSWTALVRDHAQRQLAPLTAPKKKAELRLGRITVDWWQVRGSDALFIAVVSASLRRDFPDDDTQANANGRLLGGLLHAARQITEITEAWRGGKIAPAQKKIGQIRRIFPLVILERDFPQDAALHRLMAKVFREEGLMGDAKMQPLTTLEIGNLEALATMEKPPSLLTLVTKRAASPLKNQPFSAFLETEGFPTQLTSEAVIGEFEKLVKTVRKSLGIT
ncbi:hypothetical protein JXA47_15880 [Candidatus Sumerlaeota bacterium]|nr:hypothetical protein [Candidatus Sumerlaeota bacterium]